MLRRDDQRLFCILPATLALKFTRTDDTLPLPLNTKDLRFHLKMSSEKTEDGKLLLHWYCM